MPSVYLFAAEQEQNFGKQSACAKATMRFDDTHKTWTCEEEASTDLFKKGHSKKSLHWSSGTYAWTPDNKLRLLIQKHRASEDNADVDESRQDEALGKIIELDAEFLAEGKVLSIFNKQPLRGDVHFIEMGQGRHPRPVDHGVKPSGSGM